MNTLRQDKKETIPIEYNNRTQREYQSDHQRLRMHYGNICDKLDQWGILYNCTLIPHQNVRMQLMGLVEMIKVIRACVIASEDQIDLTAEQISVPAAETESGVRQGNEMRLSEISVK